MATKKGKVFNAGKEQGASRQKDLMKDSEAYGAKYRKNHQGADVIESVIHQKSHDSKIKNKSK
jgi:hypothetical protein